MQLELQPFLRSLQFHTEVQLTSEPLRIDLLIIKKPPSLPLPKNIARRFKRLNLLEYKSPARSLSIHDFHKVIGYAFLYASLNKAPIADMTVSIIGSRHPRELFRKLEEEGRKVEEAEAGIYEIGGYPVAVQVIEIGRLGAGGNLWLRGLEPGLKAEILEAILEESRKAERAELGAYLYAVLEANPKV
jgi:hypothetical protein